MQVSLPPGTVMGIPVQVAGQAHPLRAAADGLEPAVPLPAPHTAALAHGDHPPAQGMAHVAHQRSAQQPQQPASPSMPQASRQASQQAAGTQVTLPADAAAGDGRAQEGSVDVLMLAGRGSHGAGVLRGGMAPGAHLQFMDRVTTPGQPAHAASQPLGTVNGGSVGTGQAPAAVSAVVGDPSQSQVRLSPSELVQLAGRQ